jgi:hypothetical protein
MVIIRMLRKVRGIDFLNMFFSQKNSFQHKVFNFVFCLNRVVAAITTKTIAANQAKYNSGCGRHPIRGVSGGPGLFGQVPAPIGASLLA